MSEWITDRKPTEEDCKDALGTPYENQVWVNVLDSVVTLEYFHVEAGVYWHPIVIDKPEPYVAPELKPKYRVNRDFFNTDEWVVYGGRYFHTLNKNIAIGLPTREAAERVAAIYNEVMP